MQSSFETPQRQAKQGIIIMYLFYVKKLSNFLLVLAIPTLTGKGKFSIWYLITGFLVFVLVLTYLHWRNFYFHIENGYFIINEGILRKEETLIPIERIQSIQINQTFISQLLELASLEIDTAGSGKKEVKIWALQIDLAEAVKKQLIALKVTETSSNITETEVQEKALIRFSLLDMIKVGLTENHLKMAFAIIGIFAYLNQYSSIFGFKEDEVWESSFDYIAMILPVFAVVYIFTSVGLSLFFVVIKYFNLTVFVSNKGLSMKAGLFKVEDSFVPLQKIQFIKWQSNPLQRLIGYKSLAVYQASSEAIKAKKALIVPGCKAHHRENISHQFYPELTHDSEKFMLTPEPFWKVRLYAFFVVLPLFALGPFWYYDIYEAMIAIGVYCLVTILLVYKYTANYKVTISQNLLELNKGYIYAEQVLLKVFKVQNVAIKQNIFQKRRGLVSVKLYTASGSLTIPYVQEKLGFALANKLLFDVESNPRSWM